MNRSVLFGECLVVTIMFACTAACSSPRPQVGGETHWLRSCYSDDECGDELDCICGSCSRSCATDAMCEGGRAAACYDQDSPLLLQRCAGISLDVEAAAGVCLPSCTSDAQCGGGKSCVQGACVPAEKTADAAATDAGARKPQISDFDDVQVDIAATDEVRLPELSTAIEGADAMQLLGTWHGEVCDPTQEMPGDHDCWQLVITADRAGIVSGLMQYVETPEGFTTEARPNPFPPAEDPDVGYPPGMSLSEIGDLSRNAFQGTSLPLRDAHFDNGTLSFSWSENDVYRDWCALQTPHAWTVDGHRYYMCAPQDPVELARVDPIKRALCVSASFGPWCPIPGNAAESLPCPCIDDAPECTDAVCRCDRDRCQSDVRADGAGSTYLVDGNTMTRASFRRQGFIADAFKRVTP